MDPAGADIPCAIRRRGALAAALLAVAALALSACGGSSSDGDLTPAQQLAQRGSAWTGLSLDGQRAVLRTCRLDVAAAAAIGIEGDPAPGAAQATVLRNGSFQAVLQLPTHALRAAMDARYAGGARGSERLGDGCQAVVHQQLASAAIDTAPRADFGPPVRSTSDGLRLTVEGTAVIIPARVTPAAGARLAIGPAPGRAPTTVRATVQQRGDGATVRLAQVPRGTSYLRATITAGGRSWHRLITVTGKAPSDLPQPRTFAPMVLHGEDARGFPLIYVPRDARATVTTDGSPLTLTSGRTVLLARSLEQGAQARALTAGRYKDIRVRVRGPWSIRIVPSP